MLPYGTLWSKFLIDVGIGKDTGRAGGGNAPGPFCVNCYTRRMKPGTILLIIGIAIILFVAYGAFMAGTFNVIMLLLGVAGLIVAGVGASRRWERARR